VIWNPERRRPAFVASMALRRYEITRCRMLRRLLGYPPMTIATLALPRADRVLYRTGN
jgi:hypothetical protein